MNVQERRRHPRHTSSTPLHIATRHADGNECILKCPCRDISSGGLSFFCPTASTFEIGQRIQISVCNRGKTEHLGKATIVWVQDGDNGPGWVGIMLDTLLNEEQLQKLLQPPAGRP